MLGMVTEDDDGEGAKLPEKTGSRRAAHQKNKESQPVPPQGQQHKAPAKEPSQAEAALPRIDGITYQSVSTTDGRPCIIATGNTQAKKEVLMGIGFKWNAQRKVWWKYADVA